MYDKGFSAIEKSHQRTVMELRRTHRQELDRLRQEKDQLLEEEADATQAGHTRWVKKPVFKKPNPVGFGGFIGFLVFWVFFGQPGKNR